jgi:hypothetical protein
MRGVLKINEKFEIYFLLKFSLKHIYNRVGNGNTGENYEK